MPAGPPSAAPAARRAGLPARRTGLLGRPPRSGTRAQEILAGLREVSTATLASLLRKRGLNGLTLDGLRSTRPGTCGWPGTPGRCATCRCARTCPAMYAGMNAQKRAIEEILPGEVLVIEARGDPTAGTIGDILALRAQVRGAVRHRHRRRDQGQRGAGPAGDPYLPRRRRTRPCSAGGTCPWESDVAVACAGVTIQPGDILVGDADGVVVLPPAIAAEVLAGAREQERQEEFIADPGRPGRVHRRALPARPTGHRADYEAWLAEQAPPGPEPPSAETGEAP